MAAAAVGRGTEEGVSKMAATLVGGDRLERDLRFWAVREAVKGRREEGDVFPEGGGEVPRLGILVRLRWLWGTQGGLTTTTGGGVCAKAT